MLYISEGEDYIGTAKATIQNLRIECPLCASAVISGKRTKTTMENWRRWKIRRRKDSLPCPPEKILCMEHENKPNVAKR